MKKILLSLLATLLVSITGTAQAQEYFADGYTFTYGVAKQDSLYSIVATVKSNCMVFLKDPNWLTCKVPCLSYPKIL